MMMYVAPCRHDMCKCKLPWGGSIQNSSFRSPTSPRFWRFFHKLRIRGITTYHNLATKKHFKSTSFSKPSRSSEVRAAIDVATTLAASGYDPVGCLATEAVKSFIGRNRISNEIPIEFTWKWFGRPEFILCSLIWINTVGHVVDACWITCRFNHVQPQSFLFGSFWCFWHYAFFASGFCQLLSDYVGFLSFLGHRKCCGP